MQKSVLKIPNICQAVYKLSGVVVHYKLTATIGHYVAFIRSHEDPNKWFYMNDSEVICLNIKCI